MSLEEIQSWWEVPCIAHFCSLFRSAFDLPDFDIEDLEEALIDSSREENNFFLKDLMCKLLRGYYGREDIETFNCEVFLKDTFKYNWELIEKREINPLANSDFKDLPLRTKVEILQCLCDYRLDATDIMDQLKGFDGDNMRIEPLGKDSVGAKYWYFYGSRLYKEDPEPEEIKQKARKKEKKTKEDNKKKQKKVDSVKTARGRRVKKAIKEEESSEEDMEEEEEEEEDEGSDWEEDVSVSQLASTPSGPKNAMNKTPGRKRGKMAESQDSKEPEVRRSSRGRILTKKGQPYSDSEQSPAIKQNTRNRSQPVTPARSGRRRGRAAEKDANSDSGIEEENEDDTITPKSSRRGSISSVTENSTPRGGRGRKQILTQKDDTPTAPKTGRRGRPPKANKNRNNNSSKSSSRLSSRCNSEDSMAQPDDRIVQAEDSQAVAEDSKVKTEDNRTVTGDNKNQSKPEAEDSKLEVIESNSAEDTRIKSEDIKTENVSRTKEKNSEPDVQDIKPSAGDSRIGDQKISCVNGGIEKENKTDKEEETWTTADNVTKNSHSSADKTAVEEPKEIKEEKNEDLKTSMSKSFDEKNQANGEYTMETPQNSVENDEDENNEEEEMNNEDKEEATLDEEELEEGMMGEGPRKLRARATANSSDAISEGTEKPAPVAEKRERQPFPKQPLNPNVRWHLICVDMDDWEGLAESLKESKVKCERDLYKCIVEDFLPAIPDIIEARQKEKLRREQESLPRRTSYRIELKRREQLEQEKILAEAKAEEDKQRQAEEEERRKKLEAEREEEEKKAREERQRAREERAKRLALREQRAALLAEGKEIPPELIYVANTSSSKYVDDHDSYTNRVELDEEVVEEMNRVLEMVKAHKDAWPFEEPVTEEDAPGYHDVIKRPMDLATIEKKLTSRTYRTKNRFVQDLNLMLDNCRQFNGENSDLGEMASRLQRFVNRTVKQHLEKPSSAYETDEDFRVGRFGENIEKKFRPKRGASSRARDTLRKAMDDEEFEQAMDEDDDDYDDDDDEDSNSSCSRSSRKKQNRLIPELSPTINLRDLIKRPLVINPSNINSKLEWDPEKKVVRLNGQNVNPQFLARGEAQKFSPYPLKSGSGTNCFVMDSSGNLQHTVTHNGKTFIFQNKPTKVGSKTAPSTPQRSLLSSTSQAPKTPETGQRGTVKVNLPNSQSPLTPGNQFVVQTPQGPKTIRIVSSNAPSQTVVSAPPAQAQAVTTATTGEGIKVSQGMLVVDGQVTGIPVSGKTRIIYKAPQSVGSPGVSSGKTIVKLVTTADGSRVLQSVGQPAIIRASATQPPRPASQLQPAIIQAPGTNQNIVQSPVIRATSQATKPQIRGRLIPELSAESGFSGFVPPGLEDGVKSSTPPIQTSLTSDSVRTVVGESPAAVSLSTVASLNVTPTPGQNPAQNVILTMMPGEDLLLPTPVQNINRRIDDEVYASVIGTQNQQIVQTTSDSVISDSIGVSNQVTESTTVVLPQKRKLEDPHSEVPPKQWQGDQTVLASQDSCNVTPIISSLPVGVSSESVVTSLPIGSMPIGSTVQFVTSAPVVSNFQAQSNILLGSNIQIPVVSSIPINTTGGSSVQIVSSVPVVSSIPPGPSIQIVQSIPNNVTSQNNPPVENLMSKGNLFDNLETLVPMTKTTAVSNGISNQNQCTPDSTPPKASSSVFKLSPEVMNKVSMFAVNLQSNSLASKLQGLTKSPSHSASAQNDSVASIILTNPVASSTGNLTTITTTTLPQEQVSLVHAGTMSMETSDVHATGPQLTTEQMIEAGLMPKQDSV